MREYQSGQEKADKELTDWPKKEFEDVQEIKEKKINTIFRLEVRTSLAKMPISVQVLGS